MRILGFDLRGTTLSTWLFWLPLVIVFSLGVGGGVIWAITNIWSALIHTVEMPDFTYWESVLLFSGLWLVARLLSDRP